MKFKSLLGLCLSGSLLFAGQAALADKNDKEKSDNRSARAVQVHLDKDTGKVIGAADDSAIAELLLAPEPTADLSGVMPAKSEPVQHHADGSMSIRVGLDAIKYLVVTVDEDGNKTFVHQETDNVDLEAEADKGEK